jgi:hypothetical protein
VDGSIVNSTKGFVRKKLWKMFLNETTAMTLEAKLSSAIGQRDKSARTASAARRPLSIAPLMEALSR